MQIMEMQFEIKTPNIKNFSSKTSPSGPTWDLWIERSTVWDMEDPNNFFWTEVIEDPNNFSLV